MAESQTGEKQGSIEPSPSRRASSFSSSRWVRITWGWSSGYPSATSAIRELRIAGKMACQSSLTLEPFQHPRFRPPGARLRKGACPGVQTTRRVCGGGPARESIAEAEIKITGRRDSFIPLAVGIQFVEMHSRCGGAGRPEMVDDGQRNEHGARPVAHVPEIDVEPFSDQQHFTGESLGRGSSRPARSGQGTASRRCSCGDATQRDGALAGLQHARIGDGQPRELQGEISLDGGIHLPRGHWDRYSSAVRKLAGHDMVDRLALPFLVDLSPPVVESDHVCHQRNIHDQLADPASLGLLFGKVGLGTRDRLVEGSVPGVRGPEDAFASAEGSTVQYRGVPTCDAQDGTRPGPVKALFQRWNPDRGISKW